MHSKESRENAVFFRKQGYSLREIEEWTNIPRATLSIWLRDFVIDSDEAKNRMEMRKILAQKCSAKKLRKIRLNKQRVIIRRNGTTGK